MKTMRQMLSVLSMVLGLVWMAVPAAAQCEWSALGSGINGRVDALTVFDDGTGPALYAGGIFTTAGGVAANRIAKWDGTQWSALGSGLNNIVRALTAFDDGTGSALYAGGNFTTAGGMPASNIARWRCN